ncbi:hypothetical protein [Rhodoferax saidenbachensis]|uniref:Energy-coupling factor transporter ATP-binding protein EcfA2 n=1 Tax=Rhodoferax saidenbachensis TaxID=1484693 RepID=A0ABU1ZNY2_9BURK|nr:hypothetical protein [Rhodoferax saidenbachensis]MDR7307266.1 energy-coupling factor transporter ATP-binding protein EcfA2 [Rhodoferax saidenbachensis]
MSTEKLLNIGSMNKIKINLDQSDASRHIGSGELIQQECYNKLKTEIARDLTRAKSFPPAQNFPLGSGLAYFIDGTRGAGKSTFLQAAHSALSDDSALKLGKLSYIDPSRIEGSEVILLPILKDLKRLIQDSAKRCLNEEDRVREFRTHFKRMAGGLSLFATDNDQLKDLDPELYLDWGLERAAHGTELRNNLHKLVDAACQILNVEALVLAFDDADTNAVNAHTVLECIRKYLDTPKLVVLITGDMELYSQLVRDNFFKDLGASRSEMDSERNAQRTKMVDHLEDQYLLKLFPIRRRVQLRPLWNLLPRSDANVEMPRFELSCDDWKGNARSIESAIFELIRRGLRLQDRKDIVLFYEFLLKQPLRSVLQVLSRCAKHISSSDEIGRDNSNWDSTLSEALGESLRAMALGSLYKFGIDVDALGARELPTLIEAVFELTVRDGELDTGAYLRPQPSDAALRNCFATLSADVAAFCVNNPSAFIQYLFGGPGSVAVYNQVLHRKNKDIEKETIKENTLRAQYKKYIGIGRKEDALNWAWHATAVLAAPYVANPKRPVVYFGVIGLNKEKRDNVTELSAKKAIEECIAQINRTPTFAFSLIDASGQGVGTFSSIFNIFGLMDRLFQIDISNNPDSLPQRVREVLAKVLKTPTISRPNWEGGDSGSEFDESSDAGALETESGDSLTSLCESIARWLLKTRELRLKLKPSAVLIGKVWTRIYFSLEKVSESRRGEIGAASLMELFALCIVNALLIEELDHHLLDSRPAESVPAKKVERTNPNSAPVVVAKKFESDLVSDANLPLTFLIASCPLFVGLLQAQRRSGRSKVYGHMLEKLKQFGLSEDSLCDPKTWGLIEQVRIAGSSPTPVGKKIQSSGGTLDTDSQLNTDQTATIGSTASKKKTIRPKGKATGQSPASEAIE